MKQFIIVLLACVASTYAQSDAELQDVSSRIWSADTNSLSSSQYTINPSGSRFFTYVDESAFNGATFRGLINLLDNYIPFTGTPDPDTPEHVREQQEFLDAIIGTGPMQVMWDFLQSKGLASSNRDAFINELKQYWFQIYSRVGGVLDSSGFEHVFVGEIRNGVSGFHNWVQFYFEEQSGELTYTQDKGTCGRINTLSMRWLNNDKPTTSIYTGTSPEYDFAMYTLCFVTRANGNCPVVHVGSNNGRVVTFDMASANAKAVGSAYPTC